VLRSRRSTPSWVICSFWMSAASTIEPGPHATPPGRRFGKQDDSPLGAAPRCATRDTTCQLLIRYAETLAVAALEIDALPQAGLNPPTPDKPSIPVVDYEPGDTTSIFLNWRVAEIQACYEDRKSKGAQFVTPPIDRGAEISCHMRDPDGYLIEAGQSTGLLHGQLAAKRPEDLPG